MKNYNFIIFLFFAGLLPGCSPSQQKKKADGEVYQVLQKAEKVVFGKSKQFTIDTKYSNKKPSQIKAPHLLAQSQRGGEMSLNIDEALTYAAKHSREYQTQKETLYLSALSLTGVRNSFAPNFSSTSRANARNLPDGDAIGTGTINNRVSQNLTTGGNYSLSLANDLLRYFSGDPRKSASSVISLNIFQPLLRGAGRKIAQERFTQANRNVIYAVRNYHHFQNTFSQEIVIQYLRLLQQKESVENQYTNYISRKDNTDYLRARAVDRASPQEVSDSEQGELQAKNSWINAKSRYQTSLDNFKLTLAIPTSTALYLEDNELERLVDAGMHPIKLNHRQALDAALKNRLPLINEIDRFEDTKRSVIIAADQLKAEVNFLASASLANTGNSFEKFNFNNLSSQVGLELNLPINRINERNNYRSSLIRFESNIRSLSRTYDTLNNLINRRIREIEQFRQSYEIQKNAVKLAQNRVEGNKLRLKAGTVIFRRLSESQDALINAQNAVTNALIDYLGARLQLYTDIGTLDPNSSSYWLKSAPTR